MDYFTIENTILTLASEKNLAKIESIKMDLLNRKTKLDYFLSRFLDDFEFDNAINDAKTRFYNTFCSEYETINRLLRVINYYAK